MDAYWDRDSSAKMLKYVYVLNDHLSDGEAPEALIGYYPDMGLDNILNGTYRLVSKPFNTQGGVPYVTVKYAYQADKKGLKNNRHISLWVTKKGSTEWVMCDKLDSLPITISNKVLSAKLPEGFANADSVRVALQLKSAKDQIKFFFTFDDFTFFSLPSDWYSAEVSVLNSSNVMGKLDSLQLKVRNLGVAIENNYTVSYSWDGGQVYTETFIPDTTMRVDEAVFVAAANKGWNETAYGDHSLYIWVSAIDNKPLPEAALKKDTFLFYNIDASNLFDKKVLVEEFTSSTCGPCASFNSQILNPVFGTLGLDSLVLIKYQMNWPGSGDIYYTAEGGARRSFYGVGAVPSMAINGVNAKMPNSKDGFMNLMRNHIANAGKAFFGIVFDTVKMDSVSGMLRLVYSVHAKGVLPKGKLQTVVMEDVTKRNASSNGESEFHHVMLKMMPGVGADGNTGLDVSYKADTVYTYAYTVNMRTTHMEEPSDLLVACFIQAPDGSIVQAAIQREREKGGEEPLSNETISESETLAFYPNPASEEVYLKALENASVEVNDMAGHRQYFSAGINGDFTLNVRDYKPGLYIIKVSEGKRVSVGRLNVVR